MLKAAPSPMAATIFMSDENGKVTAAGRILPEALPADPHPVLKEFYDYYRMPRGFHAVP